MIYFFLKHTLINVDDLINMHGSDYFGNIQISKDLSLIHIKSVIFASSAASAAFLSVSS
jgi:hypothetical protein